MVFCVLCFLVGLFAVSLATNSQMGFVMLVLVALLVCLLIAGFTLGIIEGKRAELDNKVKAYKAAGETLKAKVLEAEIEGLRRTRRWLLTF